MPSEKKDPAFTLSDVHHMEELQSPSPVTASQGNVAYAEPEQRLKLRGVFVMMVSDL